jgi:2-amino-4-ketopentanoate thiolase alpha subunit
MTQVKAGTWVEIEKTILTPEQRAPTLPKDTKQVPYMLNVNGFLLDDAELGFPARIRTLIGRELEGILKTVNPSYAHSFGKVVPELLMIGLEEEEA